MRVLVTLWVVVLARNGLNSTENRRFVTNQKIENVPKNFSWFSSFLYEWKLLKSRKEHFLPPSEALTNNGVRQPTFVSKRVSLRGSSCWPLKIFVHYPFICSIRTRLQTQKSHKVMWASPPRQNVCVRRKHRIQQQKKYWQPQKHKFELR